MAVVWQSSRARQYRSTREINTRRSWDIALRVSYVVLHQLDLILTVFAVSAGLSELNPVMRNLLASPLQLVVVKLVIPLLIAWLIPSRFLIPAIALISLVVIWNIKEVLVLLF